MKTKRRIIIISVVLLLLVATFATSYYLQNKNVNPIRQEQEIR
ncbi:MAG: hypothetical protein WCO23_05360 [bacterium]